MIKEYQVTLMCETNQYKPVSTIIKVDTTEANDKDFAQTVRKKGITRICQKRYWTNADLKKYHYTKVKIREYNKAKIEKENRERYEQIKIARGWIKDAQTATEREQ